MSVSTRLLAMSILCHGHFSPVYIDDNFVHGKFARTENLLAMENFTTK